MVQHPFDASEVFSAYCDDFRAAMASRALGDLRRHQGGLLASLAFGAAGLAYAEWYAGEMAGEPALFDEAARWLRAAYRVQRSPGAFLTTNASPGVEMPPGAFIYGAAGLPFVGALLAHSRRERRPRELALTRFLALARSAAAGPAELYTGSAGCLAGTAILWHRIGDPRLREVGNELAHLLLAVLAGEQTRELHGQSLAHGTAGAYYGLLLWSQAVGFALPAEFVDSLALLLAEAVATPEQFCPRPGRYPFLCSGFTGLVVLAAKAFAVLGEPRFLAAAQAAARVMLARPPATPDLCCGRMGVAFACLALAPVDPGGPWEATARDYALSALLCPREEWPTAGLYNGEPALLCLASNFLHGLKTGPPCLDLIPLPATPQRLPESPSGALVPRQVPPERRPPAERGRFQRRR